MNPLDILLTHGYFLAEDPKGQKAMKPYAPLDMLYLSSYLKSKDFKVEVFDTTFAERDELYDRLRAGRPSTLCVYAELMTHASAIEILGVARLAGWTTIIDGPELVAHTQEYLDAGANFVVLGEAEATMAELLAVINIGATTPRVAVIRGIAYLDGKGDLRQTAARELIDVDTLPWPDRKAIDLKQYLDTWRSHHGKSSLHFVTARGSYRSGQQVYHSPCRSRSARLVVDEVEWLIKEYKPDQLFVVDDIFTTYYGWLREFATEMKARNLHVPFECVVRAGHPSEDVADVLAELGCSHIWIGSESGPRYLPDAMARAGLHKAAAEVEA